MRSSALGARSKFAGDSVMAVFGAPRALEDHAERSLHAGLAMQERLGELFDGKLELRIGVNTREVVVGSARAGSSFVSGDVVNVAARLESAAEPGAILAGERTEAAARGAFEFGPKELIDATSRSAAASTRASGRAIGAAAAAILAEGASCSGGFGGNALRCPARMPLRMTTTSASSCTATTAARPRTPRAAIGDQDEEDRPRQK